MGERTSPTPSCSSADEELFKLLGVSELSTAEEVSEETKGDTPASDPQQQPQIQDLKPPDHCLRPDIPHAALLLLLRNALSAAQCSYVMDRGYRVSNDGGKHFGPNYVKEASHEDSLRVKLDRPNHHKVCVFKDEMILTWIQAFVKEMAHDRIRDWWCTQHQSTTSEVFTSESYTINPRLRLLRYDAVDDDVFVPHFDATTTMTWRDKPYESKLTILCYLNGGFRGGETLFLNGLHPDHAPRVVVADTGQVAIFNHELYHSSNRLQYDNEFKIKRPIHGENVLGGTKFVLRSDVMFEQTQLLNCDSLLERSSVTDTGVTLSDIMAELKLSSLQQETLLDTFGNVSTRVFLVPGRASLSCILTDLGLHAADSDRLLDKCENSLV